MESELNRELAQFPYIVVQLYFVRESNSRDADLHRQPEGNGHKQYKFLQELKDAHCLEIQYKKTFQWDSYRPLANRTCFGGCHFLAELSAL